MFGDLTEVFCFRGATPGPRPTPSSASSHWGCITPKKMYEQAREPVADPGGCSTKQHSRNQSAA
jgi:hypothetical protein